MVVRVGLVGARADLALMVAGVASGCGAEVVAGLRLAGTGHGATGESAGDSVLATGCDLVLVDAVGHGPPVPGDVGRTDGAPEAEGPAAPSAGVVLVHLPGEGDAAERCAGAWGATHVVELPTGQAWLGELMGGLAKPSSVVAVLGAVGGAGATTVALACAAATGRQGRPGMGGSRVALLVDADARSTGMDLPLGIADGDGARWPSIPHGAGALVPESLRVSLPRVEHVAVLTGSIPEPGDPRVAAVVRAGRSDFAATILDAGRGPVPPGLGERDAAVLVVPATLSGVVGAHRALAQMPTRRVALVVRPTGWLPAEEVAAQVGVDRVVPLPAVRGLAERMDCGDVLQGRTGRALRRIGDQVWGVLG